MPRSLLVLLVVVCALVAAAPTWASGEDSGSGTGLPWWAWALLLFAFSLALGVVSVLGGVGGGVLFVPIVSGFFPFHLDFVRGAGLILALAGSLTATPRQLRQGYAYIRLMLPAGLSSTVGAMLGAMLGLALPARLVQLLLGASILAIGVLMVAARGVEVPPAGALGRLSAALDIGGLYREISTGQEVRWQASRVGPGVVLFFAVGVIAGMFGLGAGWASVPVFNLLMGVPLKVAVGTSTFLVSISGSAAAWIYWGRGAVLPVLVVPSVLGIMIGSRIGVRVMARTRPRAIRFVVIGLLLAAGLRALLKGLGV